MLSQPYVFLLKPMKNYHCNICGNRHTIYHSMEVPLPRAVQEIPKAERENRVKESFPLLALDDDQLFANGWVNIEVENQEAPFYSWKTWSCIPKQQFMASLETLKTGQIVKLEGHLAEELIFYPNSMGLKTKTLLQMSPEGLVVEIRATEASQLLEDQAKPITEQRMMEIMQLLHHPPEKIA